MGLQAIEPALRLGFSCERESAPISLSPIYTQPGCGTVEGSRATSSILARAPVALGVCVLWLLIGVAEDKGLCSESSFRAQALVVSTETARKIIEPSANRDKSLLVSQVVETTVVEQKQILERGREQIDIQRFDAPQGKAANPGAGAKAGASTREQEWFARALTSWLRGELDEVRSAAESAAEAERIKQKQWLDQERERADTLARELTSLRVELAAARDAGAKPRKPPRRRSSKGRRSSRNEAAQIPLRVRLPLSRLTSPPRGTQARKPRKLPRRRSSKGKRSSRNGAAQIRLRVRLPLSRLTSPPRGTLGAKAAQAAEAEIKQREALEQERGRADTLAREVTSLQADLAAARDAGAKAAQAAEAEIKQREALEQERGRADTLAREVTSLQADLAAARDAGAKAAQAAEAEIKQRQALEQERGRADTLAREVTSLQADLAAARDVSANAAQAAEAEIKQRQALEQERGRADTAQAAEAEIKQREALEQERGRADTLAREVTSLRAELDAAQNAGPKATQAAEAEIKQKQALEQERGRADTLAREVTSLQADLAAARDAGANATQAAEAEIKQKQALEQGLKQERDKAAALASELTSLRGELDTARAAAVRVAEAAKVKQQQAFGKERAKTETLARELASARKEAEERSALLASAHAEALQATENNSANAAKREQALASERDRADALVRELTSVRNELEAGKKQIAALNAILALHPREPTADNLQARMAEPSSGTMEGEGRSQEQISGEAVVWTSERSSAAELARPEAQARSTASEAALDLGPKVATVTERSTSASAVTHSPMDEQRLLARANALLRQADISGARPLLEHALERGSARAAFMLAETYDARVLQSWRARGISGDFTKARELYERAQAGGIEDAKQRIEALK